MLSSEGSQPSGAGGIILPYPFEGVHYDASSTDAPVLGRANGDVDVMLVLPDGVSVTELRWLSVWCRAFGVNFGDVIFPNSFEDSLSANVAVETSISKGKLLFWHRLNLRSTNILLTTINIASS